MRAYKSAHARKAAKASRRKQPNVPPPERAYAPQDFRWGMRAK
jgi:hypothetical protein